MPMFYGDNVQDTRQIFFISWKKYTEKQPLLPLESQIVDLILEHPEYHKLLSDQEGLQTKTFLPEMGESNPFLHMGLHIAIREQMATNRPHGIRAVYETLLNSQKDPHHTEHLMMEKLADCLWLSQRNQQMPDEHLYLEQLNALISC